MSTVSTFDWREALAHPERHAYADLAQRASNWPTCATGELCRELPRHWDGSPEDETLARLCIAFFSHVVHRDWTAAARIMNEIEARTALLLKNS